MDSIRRALPLAATASTSLALIACSNGGNDGPKLENGLKGPLEHVYGPIDSVTCEKSEGVRILSGEQAYECTIVPARGGAKILCAGLTNGVPLFDRAPCRQAKFGRG